MTTDNDGTSFDLSAFDNLVSAQEEGIDVRIAGPDGNPLSPEIVITIAGPDSARQKEAQRKQTEVRLRRRQRTMTAKEAEEAGLEILASSIIRWNKFKVGGKILELSKDNAKMLLQRYPFIQEQLDLAAGDRAGFIKS